MPHLLPVLTPAVALPSNRGEVVPVKFTSSYFTAHLLLRYRYQIGITRLRALDEPFLSKTRLLVTYVAAFISVHRYVQRHRPELLSTPLTC